MIHSLVAIRVDKTQGSKVGAIGELINICTTHQRWWWYKRNGPYLFMGYYSLRFDSQLNHNFFRHRSSNDESISRVCALSTYQYQIEVLSIRNERQRVSGDWHCRIAQIAKLGIKIRECKCTTNLNLLQLGLFYIHILSVRLTRDAHLGSGGNWTEFICSWPNHCWCSLIVVIVVVAGE